MQRISNERTSRTSQECNLELDQDEWPNEDGSCRKIWKISIPRPPKAPRRAKSVAASPWRSVTVLLD